MCPRFLQLLTLGSIQYTSCGAASGAALPKADRAVREALPLRQPPPRPPPPRGGGGRGGGCRSGSASRTARSALGRAAPLAAPQEVYCIEPRVKSCKNLGHTNDGQSRYGGSAKSNLDQVFFDLPAAAGTPPGLSSGSQPYWGGVNKLPEITLARPLGL